MHIESRGTGWTWFAETPGCRGQDRRQGDEGDVQLPAQVVEPPRLHLSMLSP